MNETPFTIADLLLSGAERYENRDAVVFPDESLSYGALLDRASTIARQLTVLGARPGMHIGLLMANSPDYIAAFFGIALTGAVVVPINTRYRTVELPYVIDDAQIELLITSDRGSDYVDLIGLLDQSLPGLTTGDQWALNLPAAPRLRAVLALGTSTREGILSEGEVDRRAGSITAPDGGEVWPRISPDAPALMLYTSGTTANPSGCLISHQALTAVWSDIGRRLGLEAGEFVWAPAPLFHVTGIGPVLFSLATGATVLADTYFQPDRAAALMKRYRPAVLWAAYPPIIEALTAVASFDPADLPETRTLLVVARTETTRVIAETYAPVDVVSLYGSTETLILTFTDPSASAEERLITCGRPLDRSTEILIVDPDTGSPVPEGTSGEILCRSDNMFLGYWNDQVKTARSWNDAGWFRTGDSGLIDDDGRLQFLGRLKEMLKVGGENVAPAEVEAHLSTHPSVKLVQVVAAPDARLGEVVAAFVELRLGHTVSEQQLIDFCNGRLASFKVPRHIRFTDDWPMSATKIRKAPLAERIASELRQRAIGPVHS